MIQSHFKWLVDYCHNRTIHNTKLYYSAETVTLARQIIGFYLCPVTDWEKELIKNEDVFIISKLSRICYRLEKKDVEIIPNGKNSAIGQAYCNHDQETKHINLASDAYEMITAEKYWNVPRYNKP